MTPSTSRLESGKSAGRNERSGWEGWTPFHEAWWLDAVAPGRWTYLRSLHNNREVGVLPVWESARWGALWWALPPFTHVLGPAVDLGEGNENSRTQKRLRITADLLRQVPRRCFFRQVLDPAVPDVLAFQAHGFTASPHYTILIDCSDLDRVWAGFRQSARRFVRQAENGFGVELWNEPDSFIDFYIRNLQGKRLSLRTDMRRFESLHEACRQRDSGAVFVAKDKHGRPAAAVFAVWGSGKLYYLLTTRDKSVPDYGVVSLIIWRLMKEAQERRLVLDLDGVISESALKFLTGFGGSIVLRMIVQRSPKHIEALLLMRRLLRRRPESKFT